MIESNFSYRYDFYYRNFPVIADKSTEQKLCIDGIDDLRFNVRFSGKIKVIDICIEDFGTQFLEGCSYYFDNMVDFVIGLRKVIEWYELVASRTLSYNEIMNIHGIFPELDNVSKKLSTQ